MTLGQIARLARVVIASPGTLTRASRSIGAVTSEISRNSIRLGSRPRTTRGVLSRATKPIDGPSSISSPIICNGVHTAAVSP